MDEKREYSIDDILNEAKQRSSGRSARDISEKATSQAEQILNELRQEKKPIDIEEDFNALLAQLNARAQKKSPAQEAPAAPAQEKPKKAVPVTPVHENDIVVAPQVSNVPQIKKRMRSLDEVMDDVEGDARENKIDKAISNQKEEKASKREHQLTRTGVIRKANVLIGADEEHGIHRPAADTVGRMGNPHPREKIVGEKEDIQTKAYNEYIRRKEKKKQDTGIIKTIDIKLAHPAEEKTKVLPKPPVSKATGEQAAQAPALVIDEPTDIEKTIVGNKNSGIISRFHHTGNIEGQTRLEGFFDDEEVEKISEQELERQLELNRRDKIDRFEFEKDYQNRKQEEVEVASQNSIDDTYAPVKETPIINDIIDYNSKSDQRAVYLELEQLQNRFKLRTGLSLGALLAMMLTGIFGSGILPDFGLGTGNEKVYVVINCALLLFMLVVNGRALFKGLKALFMLKPSADSMAAFAGIITLVHGISAFFLAESGAGVSHLYVGAVGFIFLLNCFGKRSMIRRIFKNFRFLIKGGEKYSAACIADPKQIKEFSKGSEQGYYDIRYNVKTDFSTRFLANSFADDPADTVARYSVYPVLGIALVVAVVSYFLTRDLLATISSFTALIVMGVPASALMSFHKALENADTALLKERGTITGFAAAQDAAETTAIVLEASDLFPAGCCRLKGMKLFKGMQMDEAILHAASVLSDTKHPLKQMFLESVSEVKEKMPAAFDTAYESKLGLSAWIFERKVLLGTKEMMGAHGIEIPVTARPDDYIKDNSRVMFLAIDGAVYAMFVTEYFSDPIVEYELQRLEDSQIEVLVNTQDANVDEALLSELFDIDISSTKILSMLASTLYAEKTDRSVYNEAKLINKGDAITFMRSITASSMLSVQFRLLRILQYICIALGMGIIAVFALMNSIASIGPVHIVIYAAFWMIVTNLIPRIYKAVPKR